MKYLGRISRIYIILALVTAASTAPAVYLPLAVLLLAFHVYALFASSNPNLKINMTLLTMLILPLALEKILGALPAAFIVVPAIPLFDSELKEAAQAHAPHTSSGRRKPTLTALALISTLMLIFILSLILTNQTLLYISLILTACYSGIIAFILWKIPASPIVISQTHIRIVAGNTSAVTLLLQVKCNLSVLLSLGTPHAWIHISPHGLKTARHHTDYQVAVTPPLSGPGRPELLASVTDPWGLIKMTQTLEPLELHVIPRAEYAAWLAKKYLEQASSAAGAISSAIAIPERFKGITRGVEYKESRPYQPGDRLKDIDWKHSIKLQELITKEYLEGSERMAIIAANLDARNPEQADSIAYKLITSVLTMAIERIPTGLAIYNHSGIIKITKPENPRYALIRALDLVNDISIYNSGKRFLSPPDLPRARRTISQLKNLESEPARKLMTLLSTEYKTLQNAALNHPATVAISDAAKHIAPPALIAVITLSDDDTEACAVTLDGLKRRGYDHISV
jgi:uncharacterized protein (DUF58 family)